MNRGKSTVLSGILVWALFLGHPNLNGGVSGLYDLTVNCSQFFRVDYARKPHLCALYASARWYAPPPGKIDFSALMQIPGKIETMNLFYASFRCGVLF